jgi:hypothetical protein
MPHFSIWRWVAVGFGGVAVAQALVTYYTVRKLLPDDIPPEQRLTRAWWSRPSLYKEEDRELARRLIRNHRIWLVLLAVDMVFVIWTT